MTPRPAPPPPGLPPAAELIAAVRANGPGALDAWAPAIDTLADTATAAAWLHLKPETIYRHRKNPPPGQPAWPPSDTPGRSGCWTYRTLVLHRAAMPGRGAYGRGRPAPATQALPAPAPCPPPPALGSGAVSALAVELRLRWVKNPCSPHGLRGVISR